MSYRETRFLPLVSFDPLTVGDMPLDKYLGFSVDALSVAWTAWGGYWSLQFTITGDLDKIEDWLEYGLGRRVVLYSSSGVEIWEGFASEISANIGGLSITYGPLLDTIANNIKAVFSTVDYSVTPPAVGVRDETSWNSDTDSITKYGEIQLVKSVGGVADGEAEQIRDTTLEDMREPKPKETDNLSSSAIPTMTVTCLGYVNWLKAYVYNSSTTGEVNASAKIQSVLGADPNGFFSTNYNAVSSNTTQVGAWENDDRKAWSIVRGITALGDSSYNRWLFGIYGKRQAYYNVASTSADYLRRLRDPAQGVYLYATNKRIDRWNVEPGKWVFFADIFTGRSMPSDIRTDPRYLFTEQVNYSTPWDGTLQGGRIDRLDQLMARLGLAGEGA